MAVDTACLGNTGMAKTLFALISAVSRCNRVTARAVPGIGTGWQRVMMMMVMAILLLSALIWIGLDGSELMDVAFSHIGCVLSSRHHWRPTAAVVLAMVMHVRRLFMQTQ